MNPFQLLGDEHRLIARVADAFEYLVSEARSGRDVDRRDLDAFILFFREYCDLGHHDKEETLLFPAMVRSGSRWEDGPVYELRREHEQERWLLRSLRYSALQEGPWSDEGLRHFVSIAEEFVVFLRAHMQHENEVLFPAAALQLSAEVQSKLAEDMERFDQARTRDGEAQTLAALADRLVAQYRGPRA